MNRFVKAADQEAWNASVLISLKARPCSRFVEANTGIDAGHRTCQAGVSITDCTSKFLVQCFGLCIGLEDHS